MLKISIQSDPTTIKYPFIINQLEIGPVSFGRILYNKSGNNILHKKVLRRHSIGDTIGYSYRYGLGVGWSRLSMVEVRGRWCCNDNLAMVKTARFSFTMGSLQFWSFSLSTASVPDCTTKIMRFIYCFFHKKVHYIIFSLYAIYFLFFLEMYINYYIM